MEDEVERRRLQAATGDEPLHHVVAQLSNSSCRNAAAHTAREVRIQRGRGRGGAKRRRARPGVILGAVTRSSDSGIHRRQRVGNLWC